MTFGPRFRHVLLACISVVVCAAAVLSYYLETSRSNEEDSSHLPALTPEEAEQVKSFLKTMFPGLAFSLDTAPVMFRVGHLLFSVPRNYIVHMPTRVIDQDGGESDRPTAAEAPHAAANVVALHVVLPGMDGLNEQNQACLLRGLACPDTLRIVLSTSPTGSGKEQLANWRNPRRGNPVITKITDDLRDYRSYPGAPEGMYIGLLPDGEMVLLHCQTHISEAGHTITNMCIARLPLRDAGSISYVFDRKYQTAWRSIHDRVQQLTLSFLVGE